MRPSCASRRSGRRDLFVSGNCARRMTVNTDNDTSTAQAKKSSMKPTTAAWPMPGMAKFFWNRSPYASMIVRMQDGEAPERERVREPGHRPLEEPSLADDLGRLDLGLSSPAPQPVGRRLAGVDEAEQVGQAQAGDGEGDQRGGDADRVPREHVSSWLLRTGGRGSSRSSGSGSGRAGAGTSSRGRTTRTGRRPASSSVGS